MYCTKCGAQIDDEAVICVHCGVPTENYAAAAAPKPVYAPVQTDTISPKSRTVALLLAFFLGLTGAHRFYIGKPGWGFIYFFTCGFFFIGAIADFIQIACGKMQDGNGLDILRW